MTSSAVWRYTNAVSPRCSALRDRGRVERDRVDHEVEDVPRVVEARDRHQGRDHGRSLGHPLGRAALGLQPSDRGVGDLVPRTDLDRDQLTAPNPPVRGLVVHTEPERGRLEVHRQLTPRTGASVERLEDIGTFSRARARTRDRWVFRERDRTDLTDRGASGYVRLPFLGGAQ